jgi:subtilisin family serine protease
MKSFTWRPALSLSTFALFTATLASLCALVACGSDPGRIMGKAALEADTSSFPTEANATQWAPTWVEGEWVLTIGDDPKSAPVVETWRAALARSLVGAAGLFEGDAGFARAASQISTNLTLTPVRLGFGELPHLSLTSPNEKPLGFLHVKVRGGGSFLRAVDSPLAFPSDFDRLGSREALARWQLDGLSSTPGVVWAEPNLLSELFDSRPPRNLQTTPEDDGEAGDEAEGAEGFELPPEFKISSLMVQILKRVRADVAWEYEFGLRSQGRNPAAVNVAVLDTGVDYFHPELKDSMFVNPSETAGDGVDNDGNCHIDDIHGIDATVDCSRDDTVAPRPGAADLRGPGEACPTSKGDGEDDLTGNCGHGTHVAGIIAAKHGGNLTTLGICPTCRIISIRVSERCLMPETGRTGECVKPRSEYDANTQWEADGGIADISQIRGLAYLLKLTQKNAAGQEVLATNVVNMSLGKYFRSRAMAYIIRKLHDLNIVVVAAAGNDNTDTPSYPAAYSSVVSVCATGTESHRGEFGKAIFSNFGDWVDICAPGVDIYSTVPGKDSEGNGRFKDKSGTSQATPFVAGAFGYMLSVYKDSKRAGDYIRQMRAATNYRSLYAAEYNKLYRACYAGSDVCDHLLGSGMLDLGAALEGNKGSDVDDRNGRQVTSGCVVSSIGARGPFLGPHAASSLPFTLLFAWMAWRLAKGVARRLGRKEP